MRPIKSKHLCHILMLLVLVLGLGWAPSARVSAKIRPITKLMLWSHHRHMAAATQKLLDRFNQTLGRKEGIKVSLRILGDDSWLIFKNAQRLGEGPDLFSTVNVEGYMDPFREGMVAWFDDLPGFEEWKRQWPDWYWIEGITAYQGYVYAIPSQVFNSRLIYNRDLFRAIGRDPDRPPRSYQELKEVARQITLQGQGRYFGFAYGGAEFWPAEWMPSQWGEANGEAAYWDWETGRWAMGGYRRVFQLILDLKNEGSLFPGTEFLKNDALRAHFSEGKIGMFMGEFWDVGVLNYQFPAKCDWGVAAIPTYDGKFHGKSRAMVIGGLWYLNAKSRNKLQAWEVIKWFSRYDIRAKLYEESMCIDPDPKVIQNVQKRPLLKGFEDFAGTLDQDYLAHYPNIPGWNAPKENPCTVFRRILVHGGNLVEELSNLEIIWNQQLDQYYRENPEVKREWNIYPRFSRVQGELGASLVRPIFHE